MTNAARKRSRRSTLFFVQLIVSTGLLAWLVQRIEWREVLQALTHVQPLYLVGGVCLYYASIVLSCYKWRLTLRVEGFTVPFHRLVRWYLIGAFAGNFLPSDVGGDVGRAVYAGRYVGNLAAVTRSILVERLSGLAVLALLAWLGLIVIAHQIAIALVIFLCSVAALVIAWLLNRRLPHALRKYVQLLTGMFAQYRHVPHASTALLVLSVLFHVLSGYNVWVMLYAVQVNVPLNVVIPVAAMTNMAAALPITVSGWGVRETVIVGLLAPFSTNASHILTGIVLGRTLVLLGSLPGVIPLIFERKHAFALDL